MDPRTNGLRFRLRRAARQIAEQHAHIRELMGEIERAVSDGAAERVGELFQRYCSVVRAHFALEDEVFFPALHGLHPEHEADIARLVDEHESIDKVLAGVEADLPEQGLESFAVRLQALVERLRDHERREEALARGIVEDDD